jgi:hypothetical protein
VEQEHLLVVLETLETLVAEHVAEAKEIQEAILVVETLEADAHLVVEDQDNS